jgi:hypothetical protein
MLQRLQNAVAPSKGKSLAGAFSRLGWAGFWLQLVFGSLPILLLVYHVAFSPRDPDSSGGLGFTGYLTIINLLLLVFTAYWSYRYTRIGRQLRGPEPGLSEPSLIRTVWTGVVAITAGLLFSMIAILTETASVLFSFLKAPQAGIGKIQMSGVESLLGVSSIDMIHLMALVLFLFAEVIVLVFSLWLLFRTTLGVADAPEVPVPADGT